MSDKRELIEVKDSWPLWLTILTTALNFIGIIIFLTVFYNIRELVISNPIIASRINSYIGIVGYASILGIITLLGGSSLIILLNPWIQFKNLMSGDGLSKLAGAIIFASIIYSLATIVVAAN
jgi:hypothetical protein